MPRFNAPPPNGDSRKVIEQRSRDATRPAAPEKRGNWPFSVDKNLSNGEYVAKPAASSDRDKKPG